MASQFDESDFVDTDFELTHKTSPAVSTIFANPSGVAGRPPTREELEQKVSEAQQRLSDLRRAQEELERERASLEEGRRRRIEWQTGREEILQNLTRGLALLQEKEFAARRDAEQMAKTLAELRDALQKVTTIREEAWTQENWSTELTRALTLVENARMEWNSARLKWTFLNGAALAEPADVAGENNKLGGELWAGKDFWSLCLTGLALTWPILIGLLIGFSVITFLLWH